MISSHILSEIALLADDIGIIDHGALLEEESLAELEAKSSRHIRFTVSSITQAYGAYIINLSLYIYIYYNRCAIITVTKIPTT